MLNTLLGVKYVEEKSEWSFYYLCCEESKKFPTLIIGCSGSLFNSKSYSYLIILRWNYFVLDSPSLRFGGGYINGLYSLLISLKYFY